MFAQGTDGAAAVSAAKAAGGTVVSVDRKLGYAVVRAADAGFAGKVSKASGVQGAARDRVIGKAPEGAPRRRRAPGRRREGAAAAAAATPAPAEPLANRQWDMRQIGATAARLLRREPGQPEASWSASSTPASTAPTPTSRRTSTRLTRATSSPTTR